MIGILHANTWTSYVYDVQNPATSLPHIRWNGLLGDEEAAIQQLITRSADELEVNDDFTDVLMGGSSGEIMTQTGLIKVSFHLVFDEQHREEFREKVHIYLQREMLRRFSSSLYTYKWTIDSSWSHLVNWSRLFETIKDVSLGMIYHISLDTIEKEIKMNEMFQDDNFHFVMFLPPTGGIIMDAENGFEANYYISHAGRYMDSCLLDKKISFAISNTDLNHSSTPQLVAERVNAFAAVQQAHLQEMLGIPKSLQMTNAAIEESMQVLHVKRLYEATLDNLKVFYSIQKQTYQIHISRKVEKQYSSVLSVLSHVASVVLSEDPVHKSLSTVRGGCRKHIIQLRDELMEAYSVSVRLLEDPNSVSPTYFPLEQVLAILAPYWVPLSVPLFKSAINAFRNSKRPI